MARIRSVKPELRRDLTVAEWPREVRYAWVLLWGYLDDSGRGLDDLRLLTADLFPLDRDVTERKFDGWLKRMTADNVHGSPPLCRYEVDGRRFLHAPKWDRSQRVSHPQPSRIPPCPVHEADANSSGGGPDPIPNGSGTTREPFRPSRAPEGQGSGVKGSGIRDQGGGRGAPRGTNHGDDPARRLLDEHLTALGSPVSAGTRTQLAERIAECLTRATPDQTRQALARLRAKAANGGRALPGLLPRLLDDVLAGDAPPAEPDPMSDPETLAWLAEQQPAGAQQ